MARLLFLAFTVVPLVELYLLLAIGRRVGVLPTVVLVLVTGLLGALLARREGLRVLRSWQGAMAQGRLPEDGILSGLLVLVGGVLLIAPGVLTDVTGLLLLVPASRHFIAARLRRTLERRMKAGTLRATSFHMGPLGGLGGRPPADEPPPSWSSSEQRPRRGEVDADFSEDGPSR